MVDGVERALAQLLRMHHHQHAGAVGQLVDIAGDRLDVEELLHLRQHLLLGHAHHRIAGEAEPVDQRHHRFAAAAELGDETREIVFQERLAIGREDADDGAAGGGIGGGEAEEQPLAAGAGEALDAEGDGAILILGERPRIDHLEHDVAVGGGHIGIEQRAHPRREGGELRRLLGEARRHEEAEAHRLLQIGEQRRACPR